MRLKGAQPTDIVRFTLTGKGENREIGTAPVGAGELAQISWSAEASRDTGKVVQAELRRLGIYRDLPVSLAQAFPPGRKLHLPGRPHWFEERQLRNPVRVRITDFGTDCEANLVVFRPIGVGSVSPDTVKPVIENEECVASTSWRLGKGVGRQHLRASFANEPANNRTLEAIARALPRIGVGVVASRDRDYYQLKRDSQIVRVTRRLPLPGGIDSTLAFDSIARTVAIDTVDGTWSATPTLNVDWPLIPRVRHLRASLGVSLNDPDRDWYLGASILQPGWGIAQESMDMDIHLVAHLARRRVVTNIGECEAQIAQNTECDTDDRLLLLGVGIMGAVGTTGLLSTLTSIFN